MEYGSFFPFAPPAKLKQNTNSGFCGFKVFMQKYPCSLLKTTTRGRGPNQYNKAPIFALIFETVFGFKKCTHFPVFSY